MVDLPKKKVGIVACSGEELAQGTVTRLAALRVLEQLRPGDTVTICLPLFLAGGAGDRAFARFYPTIAVDGCAQRCAARGTELYSGKPAASLVVDELLPDGAAGLGTARRLNDSGLQAVEVTARRIAEQVDELLRKRAHARPSAFEPAAELAVPLAEAQPGGQAACACGSGLPVQKVTIGGNVVSLVGLPLIFDQFRQAGKPPSQAVRGELFETAKIYNPVPAGEAEAYAEAIFAEYSRYWETAGLPAAGQEANR